MARREVPLQVIEGSVSIEKIGAGLERGQQAFIDVPQALLQDGSPAELHTVHLESPHFTSHYLLTHPRAQIEPFLPVTQQAAVQRGNQMVATAPMNRITGRILDFIVVEQPQVGQTEPAITSYSVADSAFMPAIYELRQQVVEAKEQNRPTRLTEFLAGNGDIFCVWQAGKLVSLVSTREVGPVDYLEIEAKPEELGYGQDNQRIDRASYSYDVSFTDLESFEDPAAQKYLKLFINAAASPNDKKMRKLIEVLSLAILNPDLESLKERLKKDKAIHQRVENMLSVLGNLDNPHSTLAQAIIRTDFLMRETEEEEAAHELEAEARKVKGLKPFAGEPNFRERRAKIWLELAHEISFNYRVKTLEKVYLNAMQTYGEGRVFHPLRVEIRAHDDMDQRVAAAVSEVLIKGQASGKVHPNERHLMRIVAANQGAERVPQHNLTIKAIGGTAIRVAQGASVTDGAKQELVAGVGTSSEPEASPFSLMIDGTYYPTEMIHAFAPLEGGDETVTNRYRNTIPGVVSSFDIVLPEILNELDEEQPYKMYKHTRSLLP